MTWYLLPEYEIIKIAHDNKIVLQYNMLHFNIHNSRFRHFHANFYLIRKIYINVGAISSSNVKINVTKWNENKNTSVNTVITHKQKTAHKAQTTLKTYH